MSGGSDRTGHMRGRGTGGEGVALPSGTHPTIAGGGWDARAFADPIRTPTLRERAEIVVDRAARADALVGLAPHLAHGAGLVADVAAVRMAVTPPRSEDEHGFKAGFLRDHCDRTDRKRRDRLAPLVEAALETEVDRRRWDGLGVDGHSRGFAIHQGATRAIPMESATGADTRHHAALWLDAGLGNALHVTGLLLADMRDRARRGWSIEGVRRCLGDVAFSLCLGTAASVDDADLRIALSGILLDSLRADDPSRHVIRTGIDIERVRWGSALGVGP